MKKHFLILTLIITACASSGPDGNWGEPDPLPASEYIGVYEGNVAFAFCMMELLEGGRGYLAFSVIEEDEPDVDILRIESWEPVSYGIDGMLRLDSSGEIVAFHGRTLVGQIYISFPEDEDSEVITLTSKDDLATSRNAIKKIIDEEN